MAKGGKRPLYEQAYDEIRRLIASGQLAPGALVDVPGLVDDLGISRTPIREAVRQLSRDGLLELERDGRPKVFAPSVDDLADIYVVRTALESMAASIVAVMHKPEDLSPLDDSIERCRQAMEGDDWQEVSRANSDFHRSLVELSRNGAANRMLDTFDLHIVRYRNLSMQYQARRRTTLDAHIEIVSILRGGDPEEARDAVYRHVAEAGAFAIQSLRPQSETDTPSIRWLRLFEAGSNTY